MLRHPFLSFFLLIILSNTAGSAFNILYNKILIVDRYLDPPQKQAFHQVALPVYNLLAYPLGLTVMIVAILPLIRCRRKLKQGETVGAAEMETCRRRVVNLPMLQLCINFLGWIPGAVVFPFLICAIGGDNQAGKIWTQFALSFVVSAIFTTSQTFFIMEWYLMKVLYPLFFQEARPADVRGAVRISFGARLILLWAAVAVMPLVSVAVIAFNFDPRRTDSVDVAPIALIVAVVGTISGGLIFRIVGRDLERWLKQHAAATGEIGAGNFDIRIDEKRPDEWGLLTDRFNDMAADLGRGRQLHETFGQFVSPEVRDEIMERRPGLQVEVQEITVLFADIRGFTRRCAGEPPERVGALLNRFLTLALRAIEEKGGHVNKFLGDGVMALFGATRPRDDHADLAVACALDMLARLDALNQEFRAGGQAPLAVGIGIHTGPALVGCFGATIVMSDGRQGMRREFSAIGETVNYSQRLEQLTKQLRGPVLLSEQTRKKLQAAYCLENLGPQNLPGCQETMVVHRVGMGIQ